MQNFVYNTMPKAMLNVRAPIFPDFDQNSALSQKMIRAKQINDENFWPVMREVFAHDFQTLPKNRFKVWASTMNIPFMSQPRYAYYIARTLEVAMRDQMYMDALVEPMVGMTQEDFNMFYAVFNDLPTTMNRIQHMAHLIMTGFDVQLSDFKSIVELGGGIGEMTDIIYKLGFNGTYSIFDFPEVGAIQKYHHEVLNLRQVTYHSEVTNLEPADLCIATWSFTEMPLDLRDQIVEKIGTTKNWLITYSNKIFNIDNDKYIKETFLPLFTNHDISFIDVPWMPWDGGTHYLIIRQRG